MLPNLSCPRRGFAPRNAVFESLGERIQEPFFHRSEINRLDTEKWRKPVGMAKNRQFRRGLVSTTAANRGDSCIFLSAETKRAAGSSDGPFRHAIARLC